MKTTTFFIFVALTAFIGFAGCTATTGPRGNGHGYGITKQFPFATDYVQPPEDVVIPNSASGLILSKLYNFDWTGKSRAMCFATRLTAAAISPAAGMDERLCYYEAFERLKGNGSYNGQAQYFFSYRSAESDRQHGTKLKIIAEKDETGLTGHFEIFGCRYSPPPNAPSEPARWAQESYMRFLRKDPSFDGKSSLYQKSGDPNGYLAGVNGFTNALTVGEIGADNNWLGTKKIQVTPYTFTYNGFSVELNQTFNTLETTGWEVELPYETRLAAAFRLTGDSPQTYGLAEGAAKLAQSRPPAQNGIFGWSGIDYLPIADVTTDALTLPYYLRVKDATLPTIPPHFDASGKPRYAENEQWDCNADERGFVDVREVTLGEKGASIQSNCYPYSLGGAYWINYNGGTCDGTIER